MAKHNLKEQVAARAGRAQVPATQDARPPAKTLAQQLDLMVPQFAKAMPKHMDPERLARIALTEYRRNPGLAECTPQSFFGALMQAAALGTEPGLVGHAYLVPYRNRKTGQKEVQFILGYRGMLELIRRSNEVVGTPKARLVYENDFFTLRFGLDADDFAHVPWYMREDGFESGGKILGAYVHVRYKAGGGDVFYMPIAEIEKRRGRSMAKDSGPWVTDYEAMVLKTAVRAAFAWLPLSIEIQRLAAESDENVTRIDPDSLSVTVDRVVEVEAEVVDQETGEILADRTSGVQDATQEEVQPKQQTGVELFDE